MSRFNNSTAYAPNPVPPLRSDIRHEDYLQYLLDEYKGQMNEWQLSAFPNMLEGLKGNKYPCLTEKQAGTVARAVKEFRVDEDIKSGHLHGGYAQAVWTGQSVASKKISTPQPPTDLDDYEDDIPF